MRTYTQQLPGTKIQDLCNYKNWLSSNRDCKCNRCSQVHYKSRAEAQSWNEKISPKASPSHGEAKTSEIQIAHRSLYLGFDRVLDPSGLKPGTDLGMVQDEPCLSDQP